jgi:replicative DNA helicase
VLSAADFSIGPCRHIFRSMEALHARGEPIDRVTVANELLKNNLLESCGGLTYIVSLDDYGRHSDAPYEPDV